MSRGRAMLMFVVVALLVGATGLFLGRLQAMQKLGAPGLKLVPVPIMDDEGQPHGKESVYLPERVLDYSSTLQPVTRVELDWLPPDTTYGRRLYRAEDGFETLMSVVMMGTDRTSIHKPQYCLYGQGWRIDSTEKTEIALPGQGYDLPVMKLTTTRVDRFGRSGADVWRGVYIYWFVADGYLTADHGQRMWWMSRDLVTKGVLQRWAYVTCFAVCRPGGEEATYQRMKTFLATAVPEFQLATAKPRALASAPLGFSHGIGALGLAPYGGF